MALLTVYRHDPETIAKVLDFFEKNQDRSDCRVGVSEKEVIVYKREDIPHLRELLDRQKTQASLGQRS